MSTSESCSSWTSLSELFSHYNDLYFEGKVGACYVEWSSERMTLCAGYCRYTEGGGCTIVISEPLHKLRPFSDLKNTLLHEMIHAFIFLGKIKDSGSHGEEFVRLMKYINTSEFEDPHRPAEGYGVTIYHSFVDECEYYRQHWWQCNKCGIEIKRAVNRKPQPADCSKTNIKNGQCYDNYCAWHQHLKTCGGDFTKIREPKKKAPTKRLISSIASPIKRRRKNKPSRYTLKDFLSTYSSMSTDGYKTDPPTKALGFIADNDEEIVDLTSKSVNSPSKGG